MNELLGEWNRQQFPVFASCQSDVEPIVVLKKSEVNKDFG